MKINSIAVAALFAAVAPAAPAQSFFSTDAPERMMTYGVRAGINLSNTTVGSGVFDRWNVNSWGMGMEVGAEVGIHFRDFIALRPGFYFESRSGNYAYDMGVRYLSGGGSSFVQLGHYRTYHFTIPVMAEVSFNMSSDMRWNVAAGPYISFRIGSDGANDVYVPQVKGEAPVLPDAGTPVNLADGLAMAQRSKFDGGLRFGTGLTWRRRWSLSCYYLAGFGHAWKDSDLGGRNKTWSFTLGYDF